MDKDYEMDDVKVKSKLQSIPDHLNSGLEAHTKKAQDLGENSKCKSCNKTFTHSSNLHKHERIHTGERPFQCKTCKNDFTQLGHLNKHMRSHKS